MGEKTLIAVVGPTGIGKTKLAINIAQHLDTEIISSDSRQFYKEMEIGTAVPSADELATIPHHFVQHISIHQKYSVGDFEREAIKFIANFFEKKKTLVMVGGSGLYEKAVTEGLDEFPEIPPEIRVKLNEEWAEFGLEKLQNELKEKDFKYFQQADIHNPQRVIRALEVIRFTKKKFSEFRSNQRKKRDFNIIKIGLEADREIIYNRINQRVDIMLEKGLLQEAKNLHKYKHLNALQTVGYQELFDYLENKTDFDFAVSEIKKNTRRFAKRQLTWYRKQEHLHWFKPEENEEILKFIKEKKFIN